MPWIQPPQELFSRGLNPLLPTSGHSLLEAQVKCKLSDFHNNPIPDELNKFLPFEPDHITNEFALGLQLNIFQGRRISN